MEKEKAEEHRQQFAEHFLEDNEREQLVSLNGLTKSNGTRQDSNDTKDVAKQNKGESNSNTTSTDAELLTQENTVYDNINSDDVDNFYAIDTKIDKEVETVARRKSGMLNWLLLDDQEIEEWNELVGSLGSSCCYCSWPQTAPFRPITEHDYKAIAESQLALLFDFEEETQGGGSRGALAEGLVVVEMRRRRRGVGAGVNSRAPFCFKVSRESHRLINSKGATTCNGLTRHPARASNLAVDDAISNEFRAALIPDVEGQMVDDGALFMAVDEDEAEFPSAPRYAMMPDAMKNAMKRGLRIHCCTGNIPTFCMVFLAASSPFTVNSHWLQIPLNPVATCTLRRIMLQNRPLIVPLHVAGQITAGRSSEPATKSAIEPVTLGVDVAFLAANPSNASIALVRDVDAPNVAVLTICNSLETAPPDEEPWYDSDDESVTSLEETPSNFDLQGYFPTKTPAIINAAPEDMFSPLANDNQTSKALFSQCPPSNAHFHGSPFPLTQVDKLMLLIQSHYSIRSFSSDNE
ncbi:hypothetical protein L7F22_004749 [Adiantum nelumboides]|nr:hypothetical protein [Adiantum nelumboides]